MVVRTVAIVSPPPLLVITTPGEWQPHWSGRCSRGRRGSSAGAVGVGGRQDECVRGGRESGRGARTIDEREAQRWVGGGEADGRSGWGRLGRC